MEGLEDGKEPIAIKHASTSSLSDTVLDEYTRGLKLFVGGISWDTTDLGLEKFFSKFGEVTKAIIMRKNDGKTRGFGFVTFSKTEDAQQALNASNEELILDGKRLDPKLAIKSEKHAQGIQSRKSGIYPSPYVQTEVLNHQQYMQSVNYQHSALLARNEASLYQKRSFPPQAEPNSKKLFVGGISTVTNTADLVSFFSQFGNVIDAAIMKNRDTGKARGFGFVTFDSVDAANIVLSSGPHLINGKEVECKHAVPKIMLQQNPVMQSFSPHNMNSYQQYPPVIDPYHKINRQFYPTSKSNNDARFYYFARQLSPFGDPSFQREFGYDETSPYFQPSHAMPNDIRVMTPPNHFYRHTSHEAENMSPFPGYQALHIGSQAHPDYFSHSPDMRDMSLRTASPFDLHGYTLPSGSPLQMKLLSSTPPTTSKMQTGPISKKVNEPITDPYPAA